MSTCIFRYGQQHYSIVVHVIVSWLDEHVLKYAKVDSIAEDVSMDGLNILHAISYYSPTIRFARFHRRQHSGDNTHTQLRQIYIFPLLPQRQ